MKPTQKFYKMPQALFSDKYSQLSNDAKILYMLLLDRKSLSEKNHFNDENGNTVVLYSNDEVCRKIGCGHDKATKLFRELNAENSDTKTRETGVYECGKSACNKTDHNQIEDSHIYQSINYNQAEEQIKDQIEYEVLIERYSEGVLQEIVHLLADMLCSGKEQIRIGQRSIPLSTFIQRISLLTAEHIEYVIEKLEKTPNKIHNMRAYLLTVLYNSIDTLDTDSLYGN